jgi:hypothetical protein
MWHDRLHVGFEELRVCQEVEGQLVTNRGVEQLWKIILFLRYNNLLLFWRPYLRVCLLGFLLEQDHSQDTARYILPQLVACLSVAEGQPQVGGLPTEETAVLLPELFLSFHVLSQAGLVNQMAAGCKQ